MPLLLSQLKKYWGVIAIVLVYIAIDVALCYKEIYFFNLIPVILFIVYMAIARLEILYFIIILIVPISIPLIEYIPSSPIDFYIPTEPMLFGVLIIFIYKLVLRNEFDRRVINHPVSYAILFSLFWLFITSVTSSMPVVSFKFLLARLWFIITFYLLAIFVFRDIKNISKFIWLYVISMLFVIIYAITRHFGYGLYDSDAAHFVMEPFFRDHTSYGAILSMLLFGFVGITYQSGKNILFRILFIVITILIITGLILSYTRAAWISVFCSMAILIVTVLKIKFRYLLIFGFLAFMYILGQKTEIIHKLEKNRQDSSADLQEHVQSMSNITTDESNLERLNRWNSAFRMFKERPVFGWGPGTYMFKYAPFQLARNKTLVSTDFGDRGNAHSEYIGPLAESGVLGSLSFILIVITSLLTGYRVYRKTEDKHLKQMVLAFILGLITYLVHGTLNNFLDTDKASALFWGFIAIFVSLDIYYLPTQYKQQKKSELGESVKK
ncbi:MAG: O-antigen ligase family protein [Bacteroidales bacterium]|nr:O-antigen ligase family protein [Bacteroidales bacterium]